MGNRLKKDSSSHRMNRNPEPGAFFLIEVVVAIGVFAIAILSLLGLFLPTLRNIAEVSEREKATAVSQSIAAFLRERSFSEVYSWVAGDREKSLVSYSIRTGAKENEIQERVSEIGDPSIKDDLPRLYGPLFRVVLTTSSIHNESAAPGERQRTLPADITRFHEGFLALQVSVYSMVVPQPPAYSLDAAESPSEEDFLLVYDVAITR